MNNMRRTATRVMLVNWARFKNVTFKLEGSTLLTGVNGSGKSTILDAMTYLLTANTQFNKAAKDKDRTVKGYVRGDTKSEGNNRYLRSGNVFSYLAMEFYYPQDKEYFVVAVSIESVDEVSPTDSKWFIKRNAKLDDFNFVIREENKEIYTPRNKLTCKGAKIPNSEFLGRDKGIQQVMRALGLRCDVNKYRSKLVKMMAFNPENNVDQFIADCVLDEEKISSLKPIREHRDLYNDLKSKYDDLLAGKKQLEKVEEKALEYEKTQRNLQIREMMLKYQAMREVMQKIENTQKELTNLKVQQKELENKKKIIAQSLESALNRRNAALNNSEFGEMTESINALEQQVKQLEDLISKEQEDKAKILKLQNAFKAKLKWLIDEVGYEDAKCLLSLSEINYDAATKRNVLIELINRVERIQEGLNTEKVHLKDSIDTLADQQKNYSNQLRQLESNKQVFPDKYVKAKETIISELSKRGVNCEVKFFAEMVKDVKDESWRNAIETFLGYKRFDLMVEGRYCQLAMEIVEEKKLYDARIVVTDKLPDEEVRKGSAAQQLDIPNPYGRRYANYLLNGLHLCSSVEELHQYPLGGLTKEGMLAKSYVVSLMNMKNLEVCLGSEAIEIQKKAVKEKLETVSKEIGEKRQQEAAVLNKMMTLKDVDLNIDNYHLNAVENLPVHENQRADYLKRIKEIKKNPDYMMIFQEQEDAKANYNKVHSEQLVNENAIGGCNTKISQQKDQLELYNRELATSEQQYDQIKNKYPELEQEMLDEYDKNTKKNKSIRGITEDTVADYRNRLINCEKDLENEQFEYCKIAGKDNHNRGAYYIPFYRKEYQELTVARIEEARIKMDAEAKNLEDAFMKDFVAEMDEKIRKARDEISSINRELKKIPFGQDTYQFQMDNKPERALFFRICDKLENNYLDSPEYYMNFGRDDEQMESDIREFIEQILDNEDESEYTDYRNYFNYSMRISTKQGNDIVEADLAKKHGSASGGEKQTPYFIILAAGLLQCYPKNTCCVRLAFIDEAFSAMSRERLEQMVKYLEDNNFQVIYAAPPEKIASIGQLINSTVSIVTQGKYSYAVEGLITSEDIE